MVQACACRRSWSMSLRCLCIFRHDPAARCRHAISAKPQVTAVLRGSTDIFLCCPQLDAVRRNFNTALLDCVGAAWEEAFERLRDRGVRGLHHLTPPCSSLTPGTPVHQLAQKVRTLRKACLLACQIRGLPRSCLALSLMLP